MNSYYLIDYENTHSAAFSAISATDEGDRVYLFYTANATSLSLDAIYHIKARLHVMKVNQGKQMLDMHLISFLGLLLQKYGDDANYSIISNDTDYDPIIAFWRELGYKKLRRISVASTIAATETKAKAEIPVSEKSPTIWGLPDHTAVNNFIFQKVKEIKGKDLGKVASIIISNMEQPQPKVSILTSMKKSFGEPKATQYYAAVKAFI